VTSPWASATSDYDVIVVGSGVAGLSVALGLAGTRRVAVLCTGPLGSGSTAWAQGGVAAAIGSDDSPRLHARDTAAAGAGLCDERVLRCLTEAAPDRVAELITVGAHFDRDERGHLDLTREGGHRRRRVAHAGGDATGAEVSRAMIAALRGSDVTVLEHTAVLDVTCVEDGRGRQATGVVARRGTEIVTLTARAVVLATGGIGGVYDASTNPGAVTGAGLAIALRAGATLVDLEFVQFHPTALRIAGLTNQIPLITEALRGVGAVLRDSGGARIMTGHHELGDLAPRDIVARRIDEVRSGSSGEAAGEVFLDATALGECFLRERFPTVYAACLGHGIDPARQPIPVAPAQHFSCGGIRTDTWGATDVVGLYAVGEVAATGAHGANRLASNSLVEGAVFGRRIATRLAQTLPRPIAGPTTDRPRPTVPATAIPAIRSIMSRHVAIRRDESGLASAALALGALVNSGDGQSTDDAVNRWTVASALVAAASRRRESRGCHWRADYPAAHPSWLRRVEIRLDPTGVPVASTPPRLERSA
jgi:L-aspartate oxidase